MTTATQRRPAPKIPSETESRIAGELSRALSPTEELKVVIGSETMILPRSLSRLIIHLLDETSMGNAVTIIPIHAELTTQQAANYLGVSRPFLIQLLKKGDIPHAKIGTHRRVKFTDLEKYKKEYRIIQNDALDELAKQAQELKLGY